VPWLDGACLAGESSEPTSTSAAEAIYDNMKTAVGKVFGRGRFYSHRFLQMCGH
jgi:hypothetical protein